MSLAPTREKCKCYDARGWDPAKSGTASATEKAICGDPVTERQDEISIGGVRNLTF